MVLKESESVLREKSFSGKSLFVSIANTMPPGMTIEQVQSDTRESTNHIRAILRYTQLASDNVSNGLNFDWRHYENDTHSSVALISEYDAIRFLYPWYVPGEIDHFFAEESTASVQEVVDYVGNHIDQISDRFGYSFHPPQDWVNMRGRSMTAPRQRRGHTCAA